MSPTRITTEVSSRIFSLPYFVARDECYFAEEGLELEIISKDRGTATVAPVEDHEIISAFGHRSEFEGGQAAIYRACEWGQIRRAHDSARDGRVISKRAAVGSQAIFVGPQSQATHPQDLADQPIAVNFHHGSHYIAIQMLEGFLRRDEIRVVHLGGPQQRFEALRDGTVAAAALMDPWITVAEKRGYRLISEAYYVGSEIAAPDLDAQTYAAINRAIRKAVRALNADPNRYLHYLIDEVPPDIATLEPGDFRLERLRFVDPMPYSEAEFRRTYEWMVAWGLVPNDSGYNHIVDNRLVVTT